MNIQPFNENMLIRPFPKVEKTEGGVIIPDTVQERPSKATVLAISEELLQRLKREGLAEDLMPKVGDVISHVKNCGVPVEEEEKNKWLYLIRYVECLCKH